MLLKMKDDYIVNILYDSEYHSGCPTCDYNSQYIREFWIVMQYRVIYVKSTQMYGFACTEDFLFKLFLRNVDKIRKMCRKEFIDFLHEELLETNSDLIIKVSDSWEYRDIPALFSSYIDRIENSPTFGDEKIEPFSGTCAKDAAEYLNKYWKSTLGEVYTYNRCFPESAILQYRGNSTLPHDAYWLLE